MMRKRGIALLDARIIWLVLLCFTALSLLPMPARAALIESRLSGEPVSGQRAQDLETVRSALEREIVAQRLADYGLSVVEIRGKLNSLTDAQLHQLASVSDSLAEGGDGLGLVVTVLVIVLLVVVILKLMDKEVIVR